MRAILVVIAVMIGTMVAAIPAEPPPAAVLPVSLPTENDVLDLAAKDITDIAPIDRQYMRYIWVTPDEPNFKETAQALSHTTNSISSASVISRPVPLGKDKLLVLRVDLRAYSDKRINELVNVWEEFRFDPRFNLLLTKDTLKFSENPPKFPTRTKQKKVKVEPYVAVDGKTYDYKYVESDEQSKDDVVRVVGEHLDSNLIATLIDATRSQAPVVSHGYFVTRSLTTVKDTGLFKTLYGGLYYDLLGIKRGFPKGTDEDNLLEKLGVGNIAEGVTAEKIFDRLRSDQRVAVFRSNITGKPRRVDFFKTLASRDSQSIYITTRDVKTQDIDIGQHPIMNLLKVKDAAREAIWEMPNGLLGYVIFSGEGALQDEVPPDVAADTTIPPPYGTRLQPAISCIRCHKTTKGWQPVQNDAKKLLGKLLDVFDDITKKKPDDAVIRIAGLYAGNPEFKLLPRGRDDYSSSVLRATGPWEKSKDQTDVAERVSDKLRDIYARYNYKPIDASMALTDLGVSGVAQKDAPDHLKKLLPPVPIFADGVIQEDPRIGALMVGLSINRVDWDLVYAFAAARKQKAEGKK